MTKITPEELDRMERLCSAATDGPWKHKKETFRDRDLDEPRSSYFEVFGPPRRHICQTIVQDHDIGSDWLEQDHVNVQFIAAARTALPDLIAEVRRLKIQRDNADSTAVAKSEQYVAERLAHERTRAAVERLRMALKPFAEASASLKHDEHNLVIIVRESLFQKAADYLRVADLHRANEAFALAPIPPGQEGEGK